MLRPLWLASASLLILPVLGFYPYQRGELAQKPADIQPASAAGGGHECLNVRSLALNLKKQRVRRANKHNVVMAENSDKPNSMAVSQDGEDQSYFSSIQIGSEGKILWMLVDSGSANTWVFGSDCTSDACDGHETLGKEDSKSLRVKSNTWEIEYGTGTASGVQASDTFSFAGYTMELDFGLATEVTESFSTFPVDGILGLGRATTSEMGGLTVMQILEEENLVDANMFSIRLSESDDGENDGQVTFGKPDKSQFSGTISYSDAVNDEGLWKIPLEEVAVDGQKLELGKRKAVIDTGTSWILASKDDAEALHDAIPGSSNRGKEFFVPCDTEQAIQFTFTGVTYSVPPSSYVGDPEGSDGLCTSKIVGHQAFDDDEMVLGAAFLKDVYTVFDFDEHRIGFAMLSDDDAADVENSSSAHPEPSSTKNESARSDGPEADQSASEDDEAAPQTSTDDTTGTDAEARQDEAEIPSSSSPRSWKTTPYSTLALICLGHFISILLY